MCGRYYRQADKQRIAEAMHAEVPFTVSASYNVAPQTEQPVIRLNKDTGAREAAMMRWVLLSYFAKDSKPDYSTINARSETVSTSPIYREPMKKRRCLVPADGFLSGARSAQGASSPMRSRLPMKEHSRLQAYGRAGKTRRRTTWSVLSRSSPPIPTS